MHEQSNYFQILSVCSGWKWEYIIIISSQLLMIVVRSDSCGLEAFLCAAAGAYEFGDNQCHDCARGLASCYADMQPFLP